jgi:hypothetical protein
MDELGSVRLKTKKNHYLLDFIKYGMVELIFLYLAINKGLILMETVTVYFLG